MKRLKKYIERFLYKRKNKEKINYNDLSISLVKEELEKINYIEKYIKLLIKTVCILITILAFSIVISNFIFIVLKINSSSMKDTFDKNDFVLVLKTKSIKEKDVIAFYYNNEIFVKRVIATEGSFVVIDDLGNVTVDGEKQEESYVNEKIAGEYDIEFPYQIPTNSYFVLNDNRNDIVDSRISDIGCISSDDIIGKVIFRIWPLFK